jgi:hypothetical protein
MRSLTQHTGCSKPHLAGGTARNWPALICLLVFCLTAISTPAQTVITLGGGRLVNTGSDAGFLDGHVLQESQFNFPHGLALDASGKLYVADRLNGALRRLDLSANRSTTVLRNLNQPMAVAVNATNTVFVLTHGDGAIHKLDRFGNPGIVTTGLNQPTAFTLSTNGFFYVAQQAGTILRVNSGTGSSTVIASGFNQPGGIALLHNGLLAISETGAHRVRLINPQSGQMMLQIGSGSPGFRNGPAEIALFNQPHQVAPAPNGGVVVADRMNHRVRLISPDGIVTTIYGIDPLLWEGPECVTCNPVILPGWYDGNAEFAEARDPVGVAVSPSGELFTAEVNYHVIRQISGLEQLQEETPDTPLLPPVISPESGYFPMGQNLAVFDPNQDLLAAAAVYYTTDGSEPTTNSFKVEMNSNAGAIIWRETMRDLSSLRVKTFMGLQSSETTSGKPAEKNEIGLHRDARVGSGSTAVLPVVVSLRPAQELKSLQFRVEVTPLTPGAPMIPPDYRVLSISTNDFIPVVTSTSEGETSYFDYYPYDFGETRGLAVTFIGTESKLSVSDYAVVAMLAVPIPPTARLGDRYSVEVLRPSGTSDGMQQAVDLSAMPARELIVSEVRYVAGDSSPATWYNADDLAGPRGFGDGELNNNDVNNAFAASLGTRVPHPFTDLHDAMDVFPPDTQGSPGGDGLIRFLDWQLILIRSLGLDLSNWERSWGNNGERAVRSLSPGGLMNQPSEQLSSPPPGAVWVRHARIEALPVENAQPGQTAEIPVYVQVNPGYELAGMAFRATLQGGGTTAPVQTGLQFVPASGKPLPSQVLNPAGNVILCGWPLVPSAAFNPSLEGRHLLGHIRFTVPVTASSGSVYELFFAHADGAPDLNTQYDFETRPAAVFVQSQSQFPQDLISPEWKEHFFGDIHSEEAASEADPDGDGVPNWAEYLAGTHPLDGDSRLQLEAPVMDTARGGVILRWLSAPGARYIIETCSDLYQSSWTPVASQMNGTGEWIEYLHETASQTPRFYRIRVQP